MGETQRKDFFISYNKADRGWAEWIAWQLEQDGRTTVLQAWDFRPGSNFVQQMQAARHDQLLATASHLPYLLATALMGSAEFVGNKDPEIWDLVASGFLSTSRLAASDLTMMADILTTNQDMVQNALSRAQSELEQLRGLLIGGEAGPLRDYLEPLQRKRVSLKDPGSTPRGA